VAVLWQPLVAVLRAVAQLQELGAVAVLQLDAAVLRAPRAAVLQLDAAMLRPVLHGAARPSEPHAEPVQHAPRVAALHDVLRPAHGVRVPGHDARPEAPHDVQPAPRAHAFAALSAASAAHAPRARRVLHAVLAQHGVLLPARRLDVAPALSEARASASQPAARSERKPLAEKSLQAWRRRANHVVHAPPRAAVLSAELWA
jgi:hypothetical protein